jgi:hypothetical protein
VEYPPQESMRGPTKEARSREWRTNAVLLQQRN